MRRAALLVLVVPALALACSKKARDEKPVIDNHLGARDGGAVATASPSPSASPPSRPRFGPNFHSFSGA